MGGPQTRDPGPTEFGGRPGLLPYADETSDATGVLWPADQLSALHRGWPGQEGKYPVPDDAYAPLTVSDLNATRVQ